MTNEQLNQIKRLNENLEWLKNNQLNPIQEQKDFLTMKDAMKLLDRQRTWIQVRMVKELTDGVDVNGTLVRGADWIREGNRVMFKRDSILRLKKNFLTAIGDKYDNICS